MSNNGYQILAEWLNHGAKLRSPITGVDYQVVNMKIPPEGSMDCYIECRRFDGKANQKLSLESALLLEKISD